MPAPSVAVTTLAVPTWVGAGGVLQSGGSIPNGQSRWYRVVAIDGNTPAAARRHSPPSVEIGPFLADAVNRKVKLDWNAVVGAVAYRVYVRTDAVPNTDYSENTFNALGTIAGASFATAAAPTFTDQVAAPICKRPFFPSGICRAVLTAGDSGTPGTFRSFYDAILAFDPTYVQRIVLASFSPDVIGPYFSFAAWLEIGDGATTTYFHDRDSCVFVVGGLRYGASAQGVTWLHGEYDAATGRRSRGSAIYLGGYGQILRPGTVSAGRILIGGVDGCELNDSYIEDIGYRGMVQVPTGQSVLGCGTDPGTQIGNDGLALTVALRGSEVAGLNANSNSFGQFTVSEVRDLYVRGCWAGWPYSIQNPAQFDNLVIEDSVVGMMLRAVSAVQRFVNLRVSGRTEADLYLLGASQLLLRDAVFGDAVDDEDPVLRQGTNGGGTIEYESLVEVEAIDSAGAPVSGRAVSVLDSAGAVLASGVTDASGIVLGGLAVSYLVYGSLVTGALAAALMSAHVAAGKWSKTDRRPLTLRVDGAAGVEAFSLPFSPTGSVSYRVALHPDNASGIGATVTQRLAVAGVVGRIEIAGVVDREDVGGGVATLTAVE